MAVTLGSLCEKAGYDISTEIIHEDECVQKLYEMLK